MAGPIFSARICQGASGTTAAEAGYGVCGLAWTHTQAAEARESCVDRDVLGTLHANTLHEIPLNHDGRGGGTRNAHRHLGARTAAANTWV